MRVHLSSLGCRLNEAEIQQWGRSFGEAGHVLTRRPEQAQLIVLNSCAVTREAARKSRKAVRRLARVSPGAKVVVSGCYASLEPEQARGLLGVDLVIANADKDRLVDQVLDPAQGLIDCAAPMAASEPDAVAGWNVADVLDDRQRVRSFIKVQDGCRHKCAYCIVTVARGDERSRSIAAVVDEVKSAVQAGVREVVLTGVHVGGFGEDLPEPESLPSLVRAVLAETDVERLRLASVEPWEISDELIEVMKDARFMPHLHLPAQTGSDAVLRRMCRRGSKAGFLTLVEKLRASRPSFAVSTDLIVGFPGETDAEHADSIDLVEQAAFSDVHVFPFSGRAGTRAAELPDPVAAEAKRARCQELANVAGERQQAVLRAMVGSNQRVLVERRGRGPAEHPTGYTPGFVRTVLSKPKTLPLTGLAGEVIEVEITGVRAGEPCLEGVPSSAARHHRR